MIQAIIFFIVAYFGGRAIIKSIKFDLGNIIHPAAMVTGLVFLCLLFYFFGCVFGGLSWPMAAGILIVIGGFGVIREIGEIKGIGGKIKRRSLPAGRQASTSLRSLRMTKTLLIQIFFIVLVVWLFSRALYFDNSGALVAGDRLVWTDWPLHVGMASNFAWGANFPPQNPHFSGIFLNYPFMADFLSGILLVLGANLPVSFALPGIILILCFFWLFVVFAGEIVKGDWGNKGDRGNGVGFLALFISLFWGGLGWVYWLKEAFGNEIEFLSTILVPPREYTFWAEKKLWFFTFLYSEILPQRAFIFGLPMFFLVLILLKKGWDNRENKGNKGDKVAKQYYLCAGILAGILPFFHTHTFIALWILTLCWFFWSLFVFDKVVRYWIFFFVPLVILSLVQAPLFLQQTSKVQFLWGWMKTNENFFLFWFKNTGLFWPLLIFGIFFGKFDRFVKAGILSSLFLFIIPNLFQFAPWPYDNLKIMTYWYLWGSIVVAWVLIKIGEKGVIRKIVMIILILTLTLSGLVEVGRIVNTNAVSIRLWSKEDQETGQLVREKTSPGSVFLTAAIHDHPIEALAGRKIVLGYPGNSWSWGISGWDTRETDIRTMYQGGEGFLDLLKKYNINYIIVSDRERWFEPKLNEAFIAKNSVLLLENGNNRIYKVND